MNASPADSDERKLWARIDPVGFVGYGQHSANLEAALGQMAAGQPIPYFLNHHICKVCGSFSLDAALTELLVKCGKDVFREGYKNPEHIAARYALFAGTDPLGWSPQIEAAIKADGGDNGDLAQWARGESRGSDGMVKAQRKVRGLEEGGKSPNVQNSTKIPPSISLSSQPTPGAGCCLADEYSRGLHGVRRGQGRRCAACSQCPA